MKTKLALALILCGALSVLAQQQTFTVNPGASQVRMRLNTTHEVVNGTFRVQSGSIKFDPASSQITGMVVVAAGSGNTGNSSRDKKMNKDILKTDRFSTVSFAPTMYSGTIAASGESTIQVSGVFTLLGAGHEIRVPMRVHIEGSRATAKAQFIVPYVQWGLKSPSFLFWKADDNVSVDLSLLGQISR